MNTSKKRQLHKEAKSGDDAENEAENVALRNLSGADTGAAGRRESSYCILAPPVF